MASEDITLLAAARTDVGRVRKNNEDACCLVDLATGAALATATTITDRRVLLALSDGMGGAEAGEIASALVLEVLSRSLQRRAKMLVENALELSVRVANTAVLNDGQARGKRGMGATLTAVVTSGTRAFIAEVGDSRAYLLRTGRLYQLTHDQSLVQALVDRGVLTPEAASSSPRKNVILQAMGTQAEVRPAVSRLSLRRGDRLLVCCDGLSNALSDAELAATLGELEPETACQRLIDVANQRGGDDNLTAVVAWFGGDGLEPPRDGEAIEDTYVKLREYAA